MPEIIFDNCVLSNFALSGSLEVARALYGENAYITDFVAAENMKGIVQGHDGLSAVRNALEDGWLREVTLKGKQEEGVWRVAPILPIDHSQLTIDNFFWSCSV
jgi:hypothetical protein